MARMPVWKAMSSMDLAMWVIFSALALMPFMALERADMRVWASWMQWVISPVFSRVWLLLSVQMAQGHLFVEPQVDYKGDFAIIRTSLLTIHGQHRQGR